MEPWFGEEEKIALNDYMAEGGWITEFKKTEQLENMIADFVGARHCILVNNGTISLTLAALALNIGRGDEVIVPNYTMVATPNSVKMIGAKPIFVDVDRDSLCINLEQIKNSVNKNTKAKIPNAILNPFCLKKLIIGPPIVPLTQAIDFVAKLEVPSFCCIIWSVFI